MKRKTKEEKRVYITYDGRAINDSDDGEVMETSSSLEEAKREMKDFSNGCVIYSYKIVNGKAEDERFEYYDDKD